MAEDYENIATFDFDAVPERRGRKRKEETEATDSKPRGRPPGRGGSLSKDIGIAVNAFNGLLLALSPQDALVEQEEKLLTTALDRYQMQDAKAREWFSKASKASGKLFLIYAVTVISLPRLARHGLIPNLFAKKMEEAIQQQMPEQNNGWHQNDELASMYDGNVMVPPIYAQ